MRSETPLARVRGLGSAKEGAHHWWNHRLTAGGNLMLMTWFMVSIARLPAYDLETVRAWVASPWAAIPLVLLVASVCYHIRLGLQVVIEDYQHDESRVFLTVLMRFYVFAVAAVAAYAILKLALLPAGAAA